MLRIILPVCAVLASALIASAGQHAPPRPYAGFESRTIKALSPQDIADLEAGRGMGLALAAELNGWPGPLHVIENADALALTVAQREGVRAQFEAMKAETIPLGKRLIALEADLDRRFAERTITPGDLDGALAEIGRTEGALRAAHLKRHLETASLLSADQIRRYAELRGYADGQHGQRGHGAH